MEWNYIEVNYTSELDLCIGNLILHQNRASYPIKLTQIYKLSYWQSIYMVQLFYIFDLRCLLLLHESHTI